VVPGSDAPAGVAHPGQTRSAIEAVAGSYWRGAG
jgi:hypothetical protein